MRSTRRGVLAELCRLLGRFLIDFAVLQGELDGEPTKLEDFI